jgi:nucleotide-binding universal stress UspA family protein
MHGTVMVPLDGSLPSEAVLPYAAAIARATNCSLELLSVVEPRRRGLTSRSERVATEREQATAQSLQTYLTTTSDALVGVGIDARIVVAHGDPVDVILDSAGREQVSMVALTTHGRAGVDRGDRSSLGGVADKVMRLCPRPTLMVPVPYIQAGSSPLPREVSLGRLVVPLDGSPLAEEALPLALELGDAAGARLTLVRVEPWITEGSAPYGAVPEFTQLEDEVAATAQEYLTQVAERLGREPAVDTVVLRGRPAESLVSFSFHERIDLVVMTTNGRGGLRRLVLGSVADRLVRSGLPTLLARPQGLAASS